MSLFDRLLAQQLQPTKPSDGVEPAPGVKMPELLSDTKVTPFEKKRQKWLEEALTKVAPKPKPAPTPPAPAARAEPELVDLAPVPRPTPPRPPAVKLDGRPLVAVGSCKAINPETGRQCALLAGHTKAHRHGSTEFRYGAAPGQKNFSRRDALDRMASSRDSSPFTTPATGD